jgi:adenosylcobinamide kinase / adenosylcobinamide-phosphate guanylyltransferase
MKTLILGGVRSGKSRLAESLAARSGKPVTYIATAGAGDGEMRARIGAHRARRAPDWTVVEEPIRLGSALQASGANGAFVLVDCLTLWLTNLLVANDEAQFARERDALLAALPRLDGEIALVSNETGMGIMPLGELTRRFGDEAGRLHQELAQICDRVVLTVAGLPSILKGASLET